MAMGRNKSKVLKLYPDAIAHRWNGQQAVSVDRNGMLILGMGNTPSNAWHKAAKKLRKQA